MSHFTHSTSFPRILILSIAAVLLTVVAPTTGAQEFSKTIIVNPVGDEAANGTALLQAVDGIAPTWSNRIIVWIEPGVYDLQDQSLMMKPYMSLRGSGSEVTVIQGNAQDMGSFSFIKGLIHGADHSSLKDLTLSCIPDEAAERGACIHMVNNNASPAISNLAIESSGYGSHWGIRNNYSSPTLENVSISVRGTMNNYAVVNSTSSFPTIRRGEISASGGAYHNSAIFNRSNGLPEVIDDMEIFAADGMEAYAIYNYTPSVTGRLEIVDSLLSAGNAQSTGAVVGGAFQLDARSSVFETSGTGSAILIGESGIVDVRDSELAASEMLAYGGQVRLGSVRLKGSGLIGAATSMSCAAVFSMDEPSKFFATECPTSDTSAAGGFYNSRARSKTTKSEMPIHPWSEQAQ